MKLRLRASALRLRLSQKEITVLQEKGTVEEAIFFGLRPEETLVYSVSAAGAGEATTAALTPGRIEIRLALPRLRHWLQTEEVTIEETLHFGEGRSLGILVEKDFRCLVPRLGGDDQDGFPNPKGASEC